jgi:uncharacterized damage-inducible protein DinB
VNCEVNPDGLELALTKCTEYTWSVETDRNLKIWLCVSGHQLKEVTKQRLSLCTIGEVFVNELAQAIIGDSAAAPPAHILEGIEEDLAHRAWPRAPHTIYQELWHITFWQQVTLDWINKVETPFPAHASAGFPAEGHGEAWDDLRRRFLHGLEQAAGVAGDEGRLPEKIRCPSRPGTPTRIMTVREQLESLVAHNAYHFGRIVLLRQLSGAWPPASGGFSW